MGLRNEFLGVQQEVVGLKVASTTLTAKLHSVKRQSSKSNRVPEILRAQTHTLSESKGASWRAFAKSLNRASEICRLS